MAIKHRKEAVTLRLEPKIKLMAEISGRVEMRSITNFVECAVIQHANNVTTKNGETISDMISKIWDIDKDQRIKNIKAHYPDLLTYDEEKRLKELEGK